MAGDPVRAHVFLSFLHSNSVCATSAELQAARRHVYVSSYSPKSDTKIHFAMSSTGNSPVFAHVNATLQGVATIRALNAEHFVEKQLYALQDKQTSAGFLYSCATKGFSMWMDIACLAYVATTTFGLLIFDIGGCNV